MLTLRSVLLVAMGGLIPSMQASSPDYRKDVTLIVDCGSGYTRAQVLYRAEGGAVIAKEAGDYCGTAAWREPALVKVLKLGAQSVHEWVDSLQELVKASGSSAVIVGATGGLREAQAAGAVTGEMLDDFRAALTAITPVPDFRCLSSEEEAAAEFAGLQHVALFGLPEEAVRPIGLISGGGMTCQFAYYPKGMEQPVISSITVDLLSAVDHMISVGVGAGLQEFQTRFRARVQETGLVGQLHGTFGVIEMPAYLGDSRFPALEALNLGKRLVTKAEVADVLAAHLRAWTANTTHVADYRAAYVGLLPAELLALLDLLDESSQLYIAREWEVEPGRFLKPDWSLGLFVGSQCPAS